MFRWPLIKGHLCSEVANLIISRIHVVLYARCIMIMPLIIPTPDQAAILGN